MDKLNIEPCKRRIVSIFEKCFKYFNICNNEEAKDGLSDRDFNNKRTPSMNDYIVDSYLTEKNTGEEVPKSNEKVVKDEKQVEEEKKETIVNICENKNRIAI